MSLGKLIVTVDDVLTFVDNVATVKELVTLGARVHERLRVHAQKERDEGEAPPETRREGS